MNTFQTTVLGIAVTLLIIILAVIGVLLIKNKKNLIFPPTSLPCPNYWQLNADGTCSIPVATPMPNNAGAVSSQYMDSYIPVNIGSWDRKTYNGKPLPGLDATGYSINFSHNGWGSSSYSATCAKRDWAKKAGIIWDGVSNYNGCKS